MEWLIYFILLAKIARGQSERKTLFFFLGVSYKCLKLVQQNPQDLYILVVIAFVTTVLRQSFDT